MYRSIIVDLCCTCFEKTGHDAADYIRMDVSPFSFFCDEPPVVCNDKLDPEVEVVNTNMDQDINEVCEKEPIGIVEPEDLFLDAVQPHKDQETSTCNSHVAFPSKLE